MLHTNVVGAPVYTRLLPVWTQRWIVLQGGFGHFEQWCCHFDVFSPSLSGRQERVWISMIMVHYVLNYMFMVLQFQLKKKKS